MAVKWIFLWMGPGLSKVEVIHCLVRGRRTPENRPRCLFSGWVLDENLKNERIANVFEDCESTREVRNNPVSKKSKISFDPNVIVLHR